VQTRNLVLVASLFAFGCGEKSDDERLDDLVAGCESLNQAYNSLAATCEGLDPTAIDCEEIRNKTEENGCIDEAEASLGCMEDIGFESLECEDESLAMLATCSDEGLAFNDCIGEEAL
jgi:hypothetical protein